MATKNDVSHVTLYFVGDLIGAVASVRNVIICNKGSHLSWVTSFKGHSLVVVMIRIMARVYSIKAIVSLI